MQLENLIKKHILPGQLMVTIIISYLTIFGPAKDKWVIGSYIFIAIFFSTNLFLPYIPIRYYYDKKIFHILFFFDSIMICLGIYLSGNASTDFYLIYFLIIGLASMSTSLKYLMINTTVFTLVYGWILFQKGHLAGDMGTIYALRLPFIFIIALFFGSIVDTLIKDKSRSLKESEEKYRSIVESTNDTVYMVDKNSRFLSANSKFSSEHRLTEEEIIGKTFIDFHSIEETKEFTNRIDKVFETSQATHYEAFNKNLGKWVMRTLSPVVEPDTGKVKAVSVISKNITERVKAEDELKKAQNDLERRVEERTAKLTKANKELRVEIFERKRAQEGLHKEKEKFRFLVEELPIGVSLIGKEGHFKYLNPNFIEVFGYTPEDIPTGGDWLKKAYPDKEYRYQVISIWKKDFDALKTEESRLRTFNVRCKDGSEKVIQFRPVTMETGDQLVIYEDMTEQKRMEAQLRQAQKMEAVGTLAGGIAHDFNNILTTIIGNAGLALMSVGKDDILREEIEDIKIAGERAASLTRQLLAFSRKQIIQPKILDLNELLTNIENMLGRLIGEDVEILTIPRPELWQVKADPGQIEQVIMNLVVNAKDAMPKGGKLTLETANVDLDRNYFRNHGIKEKQPGSYVMLAVSDTGIGMDKEAQEHIFEPFFTTKKQGKGTGLGLSTVYGIVKQNNGFIWAYSEPGQGSTFKIYLPKAKGDVASEKKEQHPVTELGGSETVLIVEDDDSLRKLAQKALQQHGYSVLEAENGEDALRVSEEHGGSIDLMITDVVMPKMSGKETAERLQALYPQMKVIYMSGYTDDAIVHHGVLAPGLNFLEKPFTPEGLARKVREALGD